ncbi:MAG: efflux RND transporter periplasmic adaptor subunit [Taibaiella sp.]|nr:efflux RND transporter periplasmic adaptor subunit [Taibaiella sp.]
MKNLTSSISVNGVLAVPNQNKAFVTSLSGGVVRSINVQPGDHVTKGQVIGTITNTELTGLQQQLAATEAEVRYATQERDRQKELVTGNAAPLKNLQRAEAELSTLKTRQDALKQQLHAQGASTAGEISPVLTVTAPISGAISEIQALIGSQVNAKDPIATIINNSELHLDLFVYEKDLPLVKKGQTIHFTLTNSPGKEYDAEIYSIGSAFVNDTRAVPVHAHVINDKSGLIEGMSVTARISLNIDLYPTVPDDAIVAFDGKDYIFMLSDEKDGSTTFERIPVIRGTSEIGHSEIKLLKDLPHGARIATHGAFFLMARMTNTGEE